MAGLLTPPSSFTSTPTCEMEIDFPSPRSPLELLPSELLLSILTDLDDSDLLHLKKTSKCFYNFIASSAPQIANSTITKHFPESAPLFKPVLTKGWLTPTHPIILQEEIRMAHYILDRMDRTSIEGTAFLHTRPLLIKRLSVPGPTFLKFLRTRQNLWVEAGMMRNGDVTAETSAMRLATYYVRPFLDHENCKGIYVQRGFRSRKNSNLSPLDD